MSWLFNRRGQYTMEFALLVAAIAAGVGAMYGYASRAVQGKINQIQEELHDLPEPGTSVPEGQN